MPELPDITVYIDALRPRVIGRVLAAARIKSAFLVRTFEPSVDSLIGSRVLGVERLGKRIVFEFQGERFLVLHLMIAGRLLWKPPGTRPGGKIDLATFEFESQHAADEAFAPGGTLLLTEAGTTKRASIHVLAGRDELRAHDPGGIDPLTCSYAEFVAAVQSENRTLKRLLTSPSLVSGIGNAYSDEILHAAKLSPVKLSRSLDAEQLRRLHEAMRRLLNEWTGRLKREFGLVSEGAPGKFPKTGQITAFRPDFAVHGKFGKACPVCGTTVQRIVRAENEVNYCPGCQTNGKLLADRSLSRLLKDDWPETAAEWEEERRAK